MSWTFACPHAELGSLLNINFNWTRRWSNHNSGLDIMLTRVRSPQNCRQAKGKSDICPLMCFEIIGTNPWLSWSIYTPWLSLTQLPGCEIELPWTPSSGETSTPALDWETQIGIQAGRECLVSQKDSYILHFQHKELESQPILYLDE